MKGHEATQPGPEQGVRPTSDSRPLNHADGPAGTGAEGSLHRHAARGHPAPASGPRETGSTRACGFSDRQSQLPPPVGLRRGPQGACQGPRGRAGRGRGHPLLGPTGRHFPPTYTPCPGGKQCHHSCRPRGLCPQQGGPNQGPRALGLDCTHSLDSTGPAWRARSKQTFRLERRPKAPFPTPPNSLSAVPTAPP